MQVTLVRHGESTANAGAVTDEPASIPLTEKGHEQARQVAMVLTDQPTLIVVSPFLRAQQTARPTLDRFPSVCVEQWPIQEFTYLEPKRYQGTTLEERRHAVQDYWRAADPIRQDGPNAESFAGLLRRVESVLERLAEMPSSACVVLFTHGFWMQALRMSRLFPHMSDVEKMREFLNFNAAHPIANGGMLQCGLQRSGLGVSDGRLGFHSGQ